jgi:hypothetical protein
MRFGLFLVNLFLFASIFVNLILFWILFGYSAILYILQLYHNAIVLYFDYTEKCASGQLLAS